MTKCIMGSKMCVSYLWLPKVWYNDNVLLQMQPVFGSILITILIYIVNK